MLVNEIIGKTITNIYSIFESEPYGLDMAEIFIELDNNLIIDIPNSLNDTIWIKKLPENAKPIFERQILKKIPKFIFFFIKVVDYNIYYEYERQELKNSILNRKIVEIIDNIEFYEDKVLLLLDNEYAITEIVAAPHGTGRAGLHIFKKNKNGIFSHC